MAKKSVKPVAPTEPLKLFYIFYNQERWNNWLTSLREASFEVDSKSEEMPEGFRILDSFSEDITLSVLKIMRLFQNKRFGKEEALERLTQVEQIVMADPPPDLEEVIELLQLPKTVLFASCRTYVGGSYSQDMKSLVKKGRDIVEKDLEEALEIGAQVGANVIGGATCCKKYIKDNIEQPTLFDEWLIECERMNEAMTSLKDFDEVAGEDD